MIVVDTNVLAYRAIPGPQSEKASRLAALDPYWSAPGLWRSELRNVLAGYLRRGTIEKSLASQMMEQAEGFLLGGERAVENAIVFELVSTSKCTAYDCEFVALAIQLDVPLVTEDTDLLNAFPARCRSLSESLAG